MGSTILRSDEEGRRRAAAGHHSQHVSGHAAVLDIGGSIGALVIYTSADRLGDEIELRCAADPGQRVHSQVHLRSLAGAVYAAVYPALETGTYLIDDDEGPSRIAIAGGEVTELDWR